MATIRVAHTITNSHVDGPGTRTVLFVQGCVIECPGCQNRRLWDEDGGVEMDVDEVAAELLETGQPITISGGEPMLQATAVAELLTCLRMQQPDIHIIVYTGMVWADLLDCLPAIPDAMIVLTLADVLVDGPFIAGRDHNRVQWRGSSNQRPIDTKATFDYMVRGNDPRVEVITLDWDTPTLTITDAGEISGAEGVMEELFIDAVPTRRCGQTKEGK